MRCDIGERRHGGRQRYPGVYRPTPQRAVTSETTAPHGARSDDPTPRGWKSPTAPSPPCRGISLRLPPPPFATPVGAHGVRPGSASRRHGYLEWDRYPCRGARRSPMFPAEPFPVATTHATPIACRHAGTRTKGARRVPLPGWRGAMKGVRAERDSLTRLGMTGVGDRVPGREAERFLDTTRHDSGREEALHGVRGGEQFLNVARNNGGRGYWVVESGDGNRVAHIPRLAAWGGLAARGDGGPFGGILAPGPAEEDDRD